MSYGREERSWWSRNWFWALGCGCLLLLLVPLGLCSAGVGWFVWTVRSHDAIEAALARAHANPAVVEALGEPLELGWQGSFNFSTDGGVPRVEVDTRIHGPRGEGSFRIRGRKPQDSWEFDRLEIWVDGTDQRIDLLEPGLEARRRPGMT